MKKEESASIQKKTTIKSGDTMEVKKITDLPITEPPLYRKDEYFTPAATSAPIVSSLCAQLRKDLWSQDPSGLAYFLHHAKGDPKNLIEHYISNPGDISLLPWEEALQIIDKFGTNTAKLHLIFAAHTMRQEKPWVNQFNLKISDLIEEIGWDNNTNYPKYEKIKNIAKHAFALDCLTVQATWVEGRHRKGGVLASVETSRMWNVRVHLIGQQNLQGKVEQPEEGFITVRPGLWTDSFLNKAGCEAKKALYQFGYLAQDVLKIDPYHDDFALRLGLHLTVESRFHTSGTYRVQTLLEALLPKTVINDAFDNRDKARKLTNRWNYALKVLSELKRAFQIEFDPKSYPKELRPNSNARKPRGYFEQLLAAKITIHPPAPIPELLATKTQPKQVKPKINPPLKTVRKTTEQITSVTGTQIKNARKAKGWSQAKLAGLLGVSQRYISMFERGDRTPNSKQFSKIQKLLDIH
ncbi:MAG: helix-turn-helix transcriptional regulator [Xenococcaceae cyanobacterium MO_188.B29]|nr:helix-turn-helix transcriptional regulator [Xenococcaceae cyanobacterium MO_188.B29]